MNVQGKEVQGKSVVDPTSKDNVFRIQMALQSAGLPCTQSLPDLAMLYANIGLFSTEAGTPGPSGWTDIGPIGKGFQGWYNGSKDQLTQQIMAVAPKIQALCPPQKVASNQMSEQRDRK
jgi:hypothetical protein